jgi:hypothetical protein
MATLAPSKVSEFTRVLPLVFGATTSEMLPFPDPFAFVNVNQLPVPSAIQAQPAGAVTLMVTPPPV